MAGKATILVVDRRGAGTDALLGLLRERGHPALWVRDAEGAFRALDAVKIRRYLTQVDPLDKAGAYGIQEDGGQLVEKIAGSYTNVVGLPLERLETELARWRSIEPPPP